MNTAPNLLIFELYLLALQQLQKVNRLFQKVEQRLKQLMEYLNQPLPKMKPAPSSQNT
jgi:hypothetical protein